MRNPYTMKNPFMSAWLSSANKIMGAARGQAAAAATRQVKSIQAETIRSMYSLNGKAAAPAPRKRRKMP